METLTVAMEKYLEAVYELSRETGGCRVSDLALHLDVSKASVTHAMGVLAEHELVINERYREIVLTEQGLALAELLAQKHSIIRCLFTEVLQIPEERADQDACAIEHVISLESVQKMAEFLAKIQASEA